jgi:hypothetical protein
VAVSESPYPYSARTRFFVVTFASIVQHHLSRRTVTCSPFTTQAIVHLGSCGKYAQFSKTVLLLGGCHSMLAQGLPFLADWHSRRFYIDRRRPVSWGTFWQYRVPLQNRLASRATDAPRIDLIKAYACLLAANFDFLEEPFVDGD